MSQTSVVKLVRESDVQTLSLEQLRELLEQYREQLALTGQQLGWGYEERAFPYTIELQPEQDSKWIILKSDSPNPRYDKIALGIQTEQTEDGETTSIHIVLPAGASHGDKGKANELAKYLGKKLKAEVLLFNGRVMYFNPRK